VIDPLIAKVVESGAVYDHMTLAEGLVQHFGNDDSLTMHPDHVLGVVAARSSPESGPGWRDAG
jgi:hypothetical protein